MILDYSFRFWRFALDSEISDFKGMKTVDDTGESLPILGISLLKVKQARGVMIQVPNLSICISFYYAKR